MPDTGWGPAPAPLVVVGSEPPAPMTRTQPGGVGSTLATSWRLERHHRRVMFAECPELSVFSETSSARVSAPHAHPAWTLLVPVDGATVTVTGSAGAVVHRQGVLLAPQYSYRAATDGPHVALYLNA